jgi:isocitrate dehydrogenase
MEQKIHNATAYVEAMHGTASKAIRNDAANIFAGTFDEYMLIWDALDDIFGEATE